MKYHFVATEIADLFYSTQEKDNAEGSHGSPAYWEHVCAIEDIIESFTQTNDLTFEKQ